MIEKGINMSIKVDEKMLIDMKKISPPASDIISQYVRIVMQNKINGIKITPNKTTIS
jgi:hypothetical protein